MNIMDIVLDSSQVYFNPTGILLIEAHATSILVPGIQCQGLILVRIDK